MFLEFFDDFFKEANELMKEMSEEKDSFDKKCNKNNEKEPTSYYHFISDKYENGEHVSHKEKEIKDGRVLKNENKTYSIENKKEDKKASNKNDAELETKNKYLTDMLTKKENEIQALQKENKELKEKLNTIKSMFK